ncbi:MAG: hypothetical protein HF962_07725 [Sulfurovum sp.]|nr:hypothetical protein [Sulfurovum sp.]
MKKRYIILLSLVAILLSGCITSQNTHQQRDQKSKFIVMKTPVFRYADQGFVYKGSSTTKIEIYSSGVVVMKLDIAKGKVCNGSGLFSCMSKKEFNKRYLSASYPDDMLEKIFRGEAIFTGKNLIKKDKGFVQKITLAGSYNIDYTVLSDSIVFRDTVSNILIKVKDV